MFLTAIIPNSLLNVMKKYHSCISFYNVCACACLAFFRYLLRDMHYTKITGVHACVTGGQQKPFDPESNSGSALNRVAYNLQEERY